MVQQVIGPRKDGAMDDVTALRPLNDRFISACRAGSWEDLQLVLSPRFRYVDGATGECWTMSTYIEDVRGSANPRLSVDQVVVHVAGDTAGVSARTSNGSGRHNRYLDVYARDDGGWSCVQACVWPTAPDSSSPVVRRDRDT